MVDAIFRPKHVLKAVLAELVEGLEDGSITLHEREERANSETRPAHPSGTWSAYPNEPWPAHPSATWSAHPSGTDVDVSSQLRGRGNALDLLMQTLFDSMTARNAADRRRIAMHQFIRRIGMLSSLAMLLAGLVLVYKGAVFASEQLLVIGVILFAFARVHAGLERDALIDFARLSEQLRALQVYRTLTFAQQLRAEEEWRVADARTRMMHQHPGRLNITPESPQALLDAILKILHRGGVRED